MIATFAWLFVGALQSADGNGGAAADSALDLYVATDGDDAADGRAERREGSHGPLRTPAAALAKVKELRAADPIAATRATTLHLAAGIWRLDAPLVIGPELSGSPGRPLRIVGTGHAIHDGPFVRDTVLSGGRVLDGWHREVRNGAELWVADVAAVDGRPFVFRSLFANGRRLVRARHPDHGYVALAGLGEGSGGRPWNEGVKALRFAAADVAPLGDGSPADLTLMSKWVESHCRIAAVDRASGAVALRDPTIFQPEPGDLGYFESFAALDAPGEWWLDEAARRVWFKPRPGDELGQVEFVAPALTELLRIEGGDAGGAAVHDVVVSSVAFAHSAWWYATPEDPAAARTSGAVQAAFDVGAALRVRDARDVALLQCDVTACDGWGLELGRGCHGARVVDCRLRDLGGGGIRIGETTLREGDAAASGNVVERCSLTQLGRIFHSAVGLWIGQSPDNRLAGNTIADLYYTAISIGWTWGYGPARAGGNVVEGNLVHHVGRLADGDGPILSDMAAIYTLGTQEGTVIRANTFTDVAALRYGGWGIYFDEGSTHLEASGNVVLRTTHGGFHQHYGKENRVHHNLFAFGRDAELQRSRPEPHTSFLLDHDVFLATAERAPGGPCELLAGDLRDGHFDFHDNLWLLADPARARFGGMDFAAWQAAGRDARSRVLAPDVVVAPPARGSVDETLVFAADSPSYALLAELGDPPFAANPRIRVVRAAR